MGRGAIDWRGCVYIPNTRACKDTRHEPFKSLTAGGCDSRETLRSEVNPHCIRTYSLVSDITDNIGTFQPILEWIHRPPVPAANCKASLPVSFIVWDLKCVFNTFRLEYTMAHATYIHFQRFKVTLPYRPPSAFVPALDMGWASFFC
jgi:hypothetical protein